MKYRDTLGRLFTPGVIGDIPTGNLLSVDQVNGNDVLAVRGRMTVPFKTLGAAKQAAQAGDTIMVLPGTYDENNLLKNGVNWHFLPGAKVIYQGGDGAIFDVSSGAVNSIIAGQGVFQHEGTGSDRNIVRSAGNGSDLVIQGRSFAASYDAIRMLDGNGSLQVDLTEDICSNTLSGIDVTSAQTCIIRARDVIGGGSYGFRTTGGTQLELRVRRIQGASSAVQIAGGTGGILLYACEINGESGHGVSYEAYSGPTVAIYHARISGSSGNHAINISSEVSSDKLKLFNCALLVAGNGYAIYASYATTTVHLIGESVTNADAAHDFNNAAAVGSALVLAQIS